MLGGLNDNSSKGILAVKTAHKQSTTLFICDPHCYRTNKEPTISELCEEGWIRWCKTTELTEKSFYNLCLPL
uniref:UFSP1/2/DUB catalytic domain-containing protein n=1 Tax=Trichobilharzia regenti TaxID=157069 RepID=A0AA85IJE2_TRIRE|nr:unnamed protein product [Trichobilharzia regenti]